MLRLWWFESETAERGKPECGYFASDFSPDAFSSDTFWSETVWSETVWSETVGSDFSRSHASSALPPIASKRLNGVHRSPLGAAL
jgi:hypothetical protein